MTPDKTVVEIQEWLVLAGHDLVIDGVMGPKTEAALIERFPRVGPVAWVPSDLDALREPLRRASQPTGRLIDIQGMGLGEVTADYARQFLAEKPRELPGSAYRPKREGGNWGPWVRFFCGQESVPWCAGFAATCRRLAAQQMGLPEPSFSLSCDELGHEAGQRGALSAEPSIGAIALVRRGAGLHRDRGWHHCGVVSRIGRWADGTLRHVELIEGNTNQNGEREGVGVFQHVRPVSGLDFVRA